MRDRRRVHELAALLTHLLPTKLGDNGIAAAEVRAVFDIAGNIELHLYVVDEVDHKLKKRASVVLKPRSLPQGDLTSLAQEYAAAFWQDLLEHNKAKGSLVLPDSEVTPLELGRTRKGAARRRGVATLDGLSLLVPKRIADEDIGDAMEMIDFLTKKGAPSWKIHLKIASCVFWVSVNALREVVSSFLGKARARTK